MIATLNNEPFALTPVLSRGERENHIQSRGKFGGGIFRRAVEDNQRHRLLSPLPLDGRGSG